MADVYPLYNRSFLLHRLSPLHHGDAPLLGGGSLRAHATTLAEQLRGDSVRGVQVDFAAAHDTAKLGPLDGCAWELLGDEDAWIDRHRPSIEPRASPPAASLTPARARGIAVSLDYETQSYHALLLRDPGVTSAAPDGFTALPLLLTQMPGPVRDIFLNYLRTAFDAHVAPLRLPPAFIAASLETYLTRLSATTSTQTIQDVVRQLNVQLAFPTATASLKHMEITIAGPDVSGFVTRGKGSDKPFTTALSRYLETHLALDPSRTKAHISRISCNSFHLGSERLKLAAPDPLEDNSMSDEAGASQDVSAGQLAVQDFYASLVREAAGTGKFLPEETATEQRDGTPSSTASAQSNQRKRAASNAAAVAAHSKKAKSIGNQNGTGVNGEKRVAAV
ncbi:kinetochore complex Sim4 subunit Fta1-domain-containing protein [Ampelomyces quisqualis]|uniref:Kinetochore complex Sim4 subunit Fta1-domain-containing protein n=1 Tax=Ampelomyces quisqualis TaxID=50730 RepID=A0A6A5QD85_AMPQU|nr:kinetochore complex Sim4 subunit Fta1-domain-containing protein [Ampelomyces quisqualis]